MEVSDSIATLDNGIIFKFIENITGKTFEYKNDWGFTIANDYTNDIKQPRWGRVLVIGPKVKEVKVGDYILIENLQWTTALSFNDDKFWKTNESKVIMVSEEIPSQFK